MEVEGVVSNLKRTVRTFRFVAHDRTCTKRTTANTVNLADNDWDCGHGSSQGRVLADIKARHSGSCGNSNTS